MTIRKFAAVAAVTFSASCLAYPVMANLVREYFATSATGIQQHICVYAYQGREYVRALPMGTACPTFIYVE